MSIKDYNNEMVVAMAGKECFERIYVRAQPTNTITMDVKKVLVHCLKGYLT